MQTLLSILETSASNVTMSINLTKTVCMLFTTSSLNKHKVVYDFFLPLKICGCNMSYVSQFKYLGHMIVNKLCDDVDINTEVKCLHSTKNILTIRFAYCCKQHKLHLFRTTVCVFVIHLWTNFTVTALTTLLLCMLYV